MKRLFPLFLVFLFLLPGLRPASAGKRKWSRTNPEINLSHVFHGEINRRGKPTGFHSRPGGKDPKTAQVTRVMSGPNKAKVYTANVIIWDKRAKKWKRKFSSFFPDNMRREEVIEAILHAYHHRRKKSAQPWRGPSGHGFLIQGYVTRRGGINTAFPVYVKD